MRINFKRVFSALLVVGALFVSPAFAAEGSKLTLENRSTHTIDQLYFSPVHEKQWGPDQLADEVLKPGDKVTLSGISCGSFDVKLVDEKGEECPLEAVELCHGDHEQWFVDDKMLVACFKAAAADEDEGEESED